MDVPCPYCNGTGRLPMPGKIPDVTCGHCKGRGMITK